MGYFIYNDIKSTDKKVIVESMPSITKPPKRYNEINIDGSNRTDIEDLGYEAYEKPISIGLWESDLDDVYDWLQGCGKLILSSEIDKYYNAQILEQINYEKALRFRKARVVFLVQPFKYAIGEEEVESLAVVNKGNVDSYPLMTVYGSGEVEIKVNGIKYCTLIIDDYITLDGEIQEAHRDGVLKNRSMTGWFPVLKPGINEISYVGNVTKIKTLTRSRWA